ncbi:MAG: ClbS/DfsB family four-helix bundle protein [Chloroflexota bacterium]
MDARRDKNRLLETMRIERARWDMLLVQVDGDRMTVPGVDGQLSVRDILADVVRQEKWAASQLRLAAIEASEAAAAQGQEDVDAEEHSLAKSVSELMDESRWAFEQIVRHLMRLPAEDIFSPLRYEWTAGHAVGAVIPTYTLEHYRKYDGPIRVWMRAKRRRRSRAKEDASS